MVYVCTMKRGAPVANSRIKFTHNGGVTPRCARVCIYVWKCSFICVYSLKISIFSPRIYIFIDVMCGCRINQLNYLWWWINRFVFRWRAQLAALSTTNCRRIEWWNLERERVLGQSQCYSWFRGFFLTQLRVRDTVAIRFHQQWWMNRIASLVTKEFRYQVLHGDTHRSRVCCV